MPEALKNLNPDGCFELLSSCVDRKYRGMHLESMMAAYVLNNTKASWFWCTAHKDNVPSIKCITANGFTLAQGGCTFEYPHKTLRDRNLYYKVVKQDF